MKLVLQTTLRKTVLLVPKGCSDVHQNYQGGLEDSTDESNRKMFKVINFSRCPVKTTGTLRKIQS